MANFNEALCEFCQRMGDMVLRGIAKLVAVLITIFVVWYEFPELSKNPLFLWLLMTWGIYGVIIFWLDYRKTKEEKTTSKKVDELVAKLDELVTEMREERG